MLRATQTTAIAIVLVVGQTIVERGGSLPDEHAAALLALLSRRVLIQKTPPSRTSVGV